MKKKQGKILILRMCFSSCSIEILAKQKIKFRLGLSNHVHFKFFKQKKKFKFILRPTRVVATLTLGLQRKQGLARLRAQRRSSGVEESVKE